MYSEETAITPAAPTEIPDTKKRRRERWARAAKSTRMNRHAAAWKLQRSKGHRKQLRYQKGDAR